MLLRDLHNNHTVRQKFEKELGAYGMRGMKLMMDRLKNSSPTDHYYDKIEHVYRDWEKLRSDYVAPAGVPELGVAAEFQHSIPTPLGRVAITPRLNHFVSHKSFRRLGDMPQLEMLHLKFFGATHTRAEYSALVLRNTQHYLSHLLNDPVFRLLVNRHELEATLILALLHNIGHYQLSHLFEDYASEQKGLKSDPSRWEQLGKPAAQWKDVKFDIPSDDDLFAAVFDHLSPDGIAATYEPGHRRGYGEAVKGACKKIAESLRVNPQDTMGRLTRSHFSDETYDAVVAIHESVYRRRENPPPSHIVLGGILSSGLDADKVSHLMLDSNQTGIRFGLGIDLGGLLGALRSPSPDDIERAEDPLLAISMKGITAAESVLAARQLMHERVYWNPTNRAIMAMAKYGITRLLRARALNFPEFFEDKFFESYGTALRYLHELYDKNFRSESRYPNPIASVLDGERSIHQALSTFSPKNDNGIAEYLLGRTVFEVAALEDDLTEDVKRSQPFADLQVELGEILLDVPVKDRGRPHGERGGSVRVYEDNTDGSGTPLETAATIAHVLAETHESRSRVCRVFVSRRLWWSLEGNRLEKFTKHVHDFLVSRLPIPTSSTPERDYGEHGNSTEGESTAN